MLYSLFFCANPDNSFKIYLLNITSSFVIAMKSEVFDINLVVKSIIIFSFLYPVINNVLNSWKLLFSVTHTPALLPQSIFVNFSVFHNDAHRFDIPRSTCCCIKPFWVCTNHSNIFKRVTVNKQ